jgi:hypothetical protein
MKGCAEADALSHGNDVPVNAGERRDGFSPFDHNWGPNENAHDGLI